MLVRVLKRSEMSSFQDVGGDVVWGPIVEEGAAVQI
jgi:hypothetical protein